MSLFSTSIRRALRGAPRAPRPRAALPALAAALLGLAVLAAPASAKTSISSGATMVSAGGSHDCAVEEGGQVLCWGQNAAGQLGNGSREESEAPVQVAGLTGATAVSAASGSGGTNSGFTCAIVSGGGVRCWGENFDGQLGNGTTGEDDLSPVTVSGITDATAISAGGFHACALLKDGTVKCWGYNGSGQLGDGTTTSRSTPVSVLGVTDATAIATGGPYEDSCALLAGGTIDCWGENSLGQLGDGIYESSSTPVKVQGVSDAVSMGVGATSACAALADGTVRCWGWNSRDQLGPGTGETEKSATPVRVAGISTAVTVTVGREHACAQLTGDTVECWGRNVEGELGAAAGSGETSLVTSGLSGATQISAGDFQTCGLFAGGLVGCTPLESKETSSKPSPPAVFMTSHPPKETVKTTATFRFIGTPSATYECSIDAGGRRTCISGDIFGPLLYECSIDAGAWRTCMSGQAYSHLPPGDHRFEVREVLAGMTSAPASYAWTVDLPKACILKVARARVFAFTHQSKARLVIHYKAYKPAKVTVSYSLAGARGGLSLGSASSHFKTAGFFGLDEKLTKAEAARLRAASSMKVHFSISQAPSSCSRYYTKRLTIPKKVFGMTEWFQSDSIFAS